jgi:antitoxin YefM
MKVVNFSEARNQLKSVLDQVVDDANYTVITRRGAEDAVVMSLAQFNAANGNRAFAQESSKCCSSR